MFNRRSTSLAMLHSWLADTILLSLKRARSRVKNEEETLRGEKRSGIPSGAPGRKTCPAFSVCILSSIAISFPVLLIFPIIKVWFFRANRASVPVALYRKGNPPTPKSNVLSHLALALSFSLMFNAACSVWLRSRSIFIGS